MLALGVLSSGLLISAFVLQSAAQQTEAVCNSTYGWASNSLGQSPCLMAAYLLSPCNNGGYDVVALPAGYHYTGPPASGDNPCQCSTVSYSLMSACGDCQGALWETWSVWSTNCSSVYDQQYTEEIPSGTAIPGWAYLPITNDAWNATTAQDDLSAPESTGSAAQSTASSSSMSSTTSTTDAGSTGTPLPTSSSNSQPSNSSGKGTDAGAIAGGVVGGLVGLAALVSVAAFLFLRHRRKRAEATAPSAAFYSQGGDANDGMQQVFSPYGATEHTPTKLYDPSDPSTFPPPAPNTGSTHTGFSGNTAYTSPQESTFAAAANRPGQYTGVPEV